MKAIIIGGGIAGPVAATALQRAGAEATVYEAHDGPAESRELFLGLAVNGMRVLRDLGLLNALMRTDPIPTPAMQFDSWTGKRLGTVSNGWLDRQTPSITIMRGTLQRVLVDEVVARGVGVQFGKRLAEYEEMDGGIVARFEDGSVAQGDLLIGADGLRSRVRTSIAPHAPAPAYTGLLNLGGIVPASGLRPTPGVMHMVWGRRAFFGYTVRENGEAWWIANLGMKREPGRDELGAVSTAEWKRQLRALFSEDPTFIAALVDRTDEIGAFPIHDMPPLPTWHRGRAVLVGDAAHAVSPSAGQGASLAVEDAMQLARCLRDIPVPERVLARYEEMRRPRAERIVKAGRRRGTYKALENRAAVFVRDLVMPLALRVFARETSMSWIHDYAIPWDTSVARSAGLPRSLD